MSKEDIKGLLKDYTVNILMIIFIVLAITFIFYGSFDFFIIIGIFALIEIRELTLSVKAYKKKGIIWSAKAILTAFIRMTLIILLLMSWYEISFSRNYNLKYTYWIAFLLIILESIIFTLRNSINSYKERGTSNKKYNLIYSIGISVLWTLFIVFQAYGLMQAYFQPKHQIALDNLKIPQSISIYSYEKHEKYNNPFADPAAQITSQEDIEKIIKEMEVICNAI
ncbi:hypothetical protein IAI10_13460 [Clostridium sp. 19966]|uniref:hypothetical protein n=1 Tax=Clostridium sp. 19966 TaxID=2768166 RepID=UPI0028DF94F5|nr:hypothetical protein [Clostridium sp. 19966]MDT8717673.1 hypothetical protein [Clostridium sp. 19966]